ncbi:MAG TPA: sigma-54 dependent transcriptional regulator [Bryobacteraceae bacterium]|nr:sigma-54 dependent transcriptional regulator [Bryobacteraceae bacterium]
MKAKVLVIEDEHTARQSLSVLLEDEGYSVLQASEGVEGLASALAERPDVVLLDIRLPGLDGLAVLERLRAGRSDAAVLVMTADTASSTAIRATQLGAFDYIAKPVHLDHLLVLIGRALEYRQLERELRSLRSGQAPSAGFPAMVGHSPAMQAVYKVIGRIADSDATVLIQGESGTGKELVVNAIHEHGSRGRGPLVKVNCAAIPEALLEAELFGHEKGAFTGAVLRRTGRFEDANGGTLFLDEVAELTMSLQAKLLRAVQERTIERLGSSQPVRTDFRLVVATAQNLDHAVADGLFREDLYYRLNVVQIVLPPLRERREDIPLLVQRFLSRSARPVTIRPEALDRILAHSWPGNVRELENVMTRAIALAPGGVITEDSIKFPRRTSNELGWLQQVPYQQGYKHVLRQVEAHVIQAALLEAGGNKLKAAGILGIQRRLLYDKMREYGLKP